MLVGTGKLASPMSLFLCVGGILILLAVSYLNTQRCLVDLQSFEDSTGLHRCLLVGLVLAIGWMLIWDVQTGSLCVASFVLSLF